MSNVVIVSGIRTAVGAFGGGLKDVPAKDLGALVIKGVLEKVGLSPVVSLQMKQDAPDKCKDDGLCSVEQQHCKWPEGKEIVVDVSMSKFWITDMACRVADRCVQLHGGYGYCEEYPIARAWRDIRVTRIFAGTNEIMKVICARFMGL